MNAHRSTLVVLVLAALVCVSCMESELFLASDSRLPKWFTLPANLTRSDVEVRIRYYTPGTLRIALLGPGQRVIQSVSGVQRWDPETERRGFGDYPTYQTVTVNGVDEIIEQRSRSNILYVTDSVPHSDAERLAISRIELRRQIASIDQSDSFQLELAAELALQAEEYQVLAEVASRLLHNATTSRNCDCNYDIHKANVFLGLAALRQGNVQDAKVDLLAAGHVRGSPVLKTFGPNMRLAKELLQRGEKDVVIEYFDLCSKFWSDGQAELAAWRGQVLMGQTPNFGSNISY